ncbi:MAG: bile acid:sodium symporter family protein [Hungatella sp.]|jgi:BASS family bile acid:Na+ symporter|nr:bile acid:sodium symporter family protein [Hungatella sp.]
MKTLLKVSKVIQGNFAIFTVVLAALGYFFPGLFAWAGPHTTLFMGIVMFGMSMTMSASDFKALVVKPKATIIGIFLVYALSSAVTYVAVMVLHLPMDLSVGLILCAACPGGVITNVMTFIANGDVALSVGLTSIGTIIAPIVTPALAFLMVGKWTEVDAVSMMVSMFKSVVLPLLIGLSLKAVMKEKLKKVEEAAPLLSLLSLSVIIGAIVARNGKALFTCNVLIFAACLLYILLPLVGSYYASRIAGISVVQSRTIAIETSLKNSILASTLASANFTDLPGAALPGVIVALLASIIGPVIANIWHKKDENGEHAV